MEKLNYQGRTLDDSLVREGLKSVGILDTFPSSRGLYSVVGGIATQSYIPSSYRRPTSDVDLLIGRPLNYEDFKTFSKPVMDFLRDNGYSVRTTKRSRAFNLILETPDNQALLIEFSRRNPNSFERSRSRIEREIENSRKKKIEGEKDKSYTVCSPEDIVGPKLMRIVNDLKRDNRLGSYLSPYINTTSFSDDFMIEKLKEINQLRDEASLNLGNEEVAGELKLSSDIYDVILLMAMAGVNEQYFDEVLQRWTCLREQTPQRDLVFRTLLPSSDVVPV